ATTGGAPVALVGAGSTFIKPVMLQWISQYKSVAANVSLNYQGIGSGGGIQQFTKQAIDFAASDAFMKPDEITAATSARKCGVLHIPAVHGAVVLAYNLKGVSLTLDGPTVAKIYL